VSTEAVWRMRGPRHGEIRGAYRLGDKKVKGQERAPAHLGTSVKVSAKREGENVR
jgi:hypothetical protein